MSNEEVLKENGRKRFSICLQNPPYGTFGGENTNLKFVEKCLDISEKQIVVMPSNFIKRDSKSFKKYKEKFDNNFISAEEVDSKIFGETNMQNVAIYEFGNRNDKKITIKYLDGRIENLNSLFEKDYNSFSDYEKEIFKYLKNDNPNYHDFNKRIKPLNEYTNQRINGLKDGVYLLTNLTNGCSHGPWNSCYISSKLGQIFDNKNDLKKCMLERNGARCNIMIFNTIKEAENCKIALQNPLLRLSLYKLQTDPGLNKLQYSYIPNIDWSDDRVKTDEGLLELCGCPKDKCKEYADYCKKVIEEVDNK